MAMRAIAAGIACRAEGDVMTVQAPYVRHFAAIIAATAMCALVLQYVLLVRVTQETVGPFFATLRFFSYFTILSNLLVLLASSTAAFAGGSSLGRWFARPTVRG